MTRTISIITATVGAALLFVVPAYGDSWGADKAQPLAQPDPMIEDGFAQAVAVAKQIRIERMLDARERGLGVTNTPADFWNYESGTKVADTSPGVASEDLARLFASDDKLTVDARSEGMNRLYGLGEYANPIDLRERGLVEKSQAQTKVEQPTAGFDARSDGLNRIYGLGEYAPSVVADDRFRIDHSNVPEPVSVTSSGRDIEWPQVGIGFGVGLVLLLGLGLTLKATHTRPFAH